MAWGEHCFSVTNNSAKSRTVHTMCCCMVKQVQSTFDTHPVPLAVHAYFEYKGGESTIIRDHKKDNVIHMLFLPRRPYMYIDSMLSSSFPPTTGLVMCISIVLWLVQYVPCLASFSPALASSLVSLDGAVPWVINLQEVVIVISKVPPWAYF